MTTIKSYTDISQSKKFAEILPLGSADMCWQYQKDRWVGEPDYKKSPQFEHATDKRDIPCWSLAALLGVLPSSIKDSIGMVYSLNMDKEYIEYSNPTISSLYSVYIHTCGNDNLVDACYEMILKLNKLNLL